MQSNDRRICHLQESFIPVAYFWKYETLKINHYAWVIRGGQVHFSGPIFVYKIRYKKPPESQYLGTKLDMLFQNAKLVEIATI